MTRSGWPQALDGLALWHQRRDAQAARDAIAFIEPELRLAIPPLVRRSWPSELVDDAVREFLARLLDRPLPDGIGQPRAYVLRMFRNRCIDIHRARQRRQETPLEPDGDWPEAGDQISPDERIAQHQRATRIADAVAKLPIADRVALKLVDAPEWLDGEELEWLSERIGLEPDELRTRLAMARDTFELTLLFDPVEDEVTPSLRRKRMERFRRRRGRAREVLREILGAWGQP